MPAPEDGRPGEGQRLTPDAPHTSGRPTPPGTDPHHPRGTQPPQGVRQGDSAWFPHPHTRAHSTWRAEPDSPPGGPAVGRGGATDLRRPSQRQKAPPPGTPFRYPRSAQRRPARAHAVGPVLGPHARANRTRDTRVAEPRLPAPGDGRPGEGQRLTPDAPSRRRRATPPGDSPTTPRHAAPTGHANQGDNAGPPRPHTCAHNTWVAEGERPIPDAPRNGERRPQRGHPSASARKGARREAEAGSPSPHQPHPGHTGRKTPAGRRAGSRGRGSA